MLFNIEPLSLCQDDFEPYHVPLLATEDSSHYLVVLLAPSTIVSGASLIQVRSALVMCFGTVSPMPIGMIQAAPVTYDIVQEVPSFSVDIWTRSKLFVLCRPGTRASTFKLGGLHEEASTCPFILLLSDPLSFCSGELPAI